MLCPLSHPVNNSAGCRWRWGGAIPQKMRGLTKQYDPTNIGELPQTSARTSCDSLGIKTTVLKKHTYCRLKPGGTGTAYTCSSQGKVSPLRGTGCPVRSQLSVKHGKYTDCPLCLIGWQNRANDGIGVRLDEGPRRIRVVVRRVKSSSSMCCPLVALLELRFLTAPRHLLCFLNLRSGHE